MEWLGWIVAALLGGVVSWLLSVNKKLQAQVAEQAEQAEALDTARRRALEDRDATVRRVRQSAEERVRYSQEPLLKGLLPVVDNLERALVVKEDAPPENLFRGVRMVFDQLLSELRRHGVTSIDASGDDFDPRVHEAIGRAPSRELPPGRVVEQWERGFKLHDRLLRPARVVVATDVPLDAPAEE